MATENKVLMQQAREALKGKWGLAIGGYFLYTLIAVLVNIPEDVGWLLWLIISGPMSIGLATFSLSLARGEETSVSKLFIGFHEFWRAFVANFLVGLFTLLWMLLLIIPGIIAALAYSQTFFILADDKAIGARDAIRKSKAMMDGNKWKFFLLGLRFLGWALLCVLTLGIGFLWLIPYMHVSLAKFYEDVSKKPAETKAAQD